jgi:hypothetical protein
LVIRTSTSFQNSSKRASALARPIIAINKGSKSIRKNISRLQDEVFVVLASEKQ